VAIKPCGKGMLLETLHYEEEIKKSDSFFSEIPAKSADPDLLEVATALIDKKTDKFDPKIFKNHYQAALRELIARKLKSKGRKIAVEEEAPRGKETSNVIDLMAALKKSLETGERTASKAATVKKPTARRSPAVRDQRVDGGGDRAGGADRGLDRRRARDRRPKADVVHGAGALAARRRRG